VADEQRRATRRTSLRASVSRKALGRHSLAAGDVPKSTTVIARLDILVTRQARNLLVVEVKAEHLALTDDDRDQGISYAVSFTR
jgi:hypothetical protein